VKITLPQLRRIIKEEAAKLLKEAPTPVPFTDLGEIPGYEDYGPAHKAHFIPADDYPGLYHVATEDPDDYGSGPMVLDDPYNDPFLYDNNGTRLLFNADGKLVNPDGTLKEHFRKSYRRFTR
jgi:hypothetical protein